MYRFALPLIFFASAFGAGTVPVPSIFTTCPGRSTKVTGDCLKPAVQSAMAALASEGLKVLGVLPIDPLQVTTLIINQGSGPVAVDLRLKDVSITGTRHIKVESVVPKFTDETVELAIKLSTKQVLGILGNYKVDGKVLILPIQGEGEVKIDLNDVEAIIQIKLKIITKDGEKRLEVSSVTFKLKPKQVKLNFENLFNGDKALGDGMNKFLNENWSEVYGELEGPIEEAFARILFELIKRCMEKLKYDDIFPK